MSQQPVPVEPLSYYPETHHSWLPIVKAAAVAAMALGTGQLMYLACQILGALVASVRIATFGNFFGIGLEMIGGAAGAGTIFFGYRCLRVNAFARRLLVITLAAAVLVSMISAVSSTIYIYSTLARITPPFRLIPVQLGMVFTGLLRTLILPLLLIWILTRNQVKEIFREAHS